MAAYKAIYFIWGNEGFLIDEELNKIVNMVHEEEGTLPELVYLDTDYLDPRSLLEALDFSSLFNLARVVLIRRPGWLSRGRKRKDKADEYIRALGIYLENPPPGQVIIISTEDNPASIVDKGLMQKVEVRAVKTPDPQNLAAWVQKRFEHNQRPVDNKLARLVASSGQDMYYLENFINKLSLMNTGPVSQEEIEAELGSGEEIKIFKLSDALLRRDLNLAIHCYQQLLSQGGSETFFLYIIVRQFIQMAKVKHYAGQGKTNQEIENLTGMKGFIVRVKKEQSGRFSWEELMVLFAAFLDADRRLKSTGQDNGLVMEELIVRICRK